MTAVAREPEAFDRLVDWLWRIDVTPGEWLLGICIACVVLFGLAAL